MRIYLAVAIDKNSSSDTDTVDALIALQRLAEDSRQSLVVYSPNRAFAINRTPISYMEDLDYLIQLNTYALLKCDVAIFIHRAGVETWGMPQELQECKHLDKIVIVVTDQPTETLPIYLIANVPQAHIVSSIEQAWEIIKQVEEPF